MTLTNGLNNAAASYPDRATMANYYASMYPPIVGACHPYIMAVADEMDDAANYPLLPRERFEAMADRIMDRLEGAQLVQFRDRRRDRDFDFDFDRRRHLARGLIAALLIAELLRRRRFFI